MRSIALCGLLLSACAVSGCGGYWYAAPELRGDVLQVIVTQDANENCGNSNSLGCWIPMLGIVFIKAGMSYATAQCVERHERKHASGMAHDNRPVYRLDCGEE